MIARKILALPSVVQQAAPENVSTLFEDEDDDEKEYEGASYSTTQAVSWPLV